MDRILAALAATALIAQLGACTWVQTTPEGQKVSVGTADSVATCQRLGKVTVSVKSRVGGVERKPGKVAGELATLARNEGATMGGDTVVAESEDLNGSQVFGVYDCKG